MRWAEGNSDPKYAHLRRTETVRANAYGRADAALEALEGYLDIGEAEAWCKSCRRVWEGPRHQCRSDAERRLAEARAIHRELCPVATGKVGPPDFTCSLCDALDGSPTEPESGCSACGGPHLWADCTDYSSLVRNDQAFITHTDQFDQVPREGPQ
jgi:hypothetical protein